MKTSRMLDADDIARGQQVRLRRELCSKAIDFVEGELVPFNNLILSLEGRVALLERERDAAYDLLKRTTETSNQVDLSRGYDNLRFTAGLHFSELVDDDRAANVLAGMSLSFSHLQDSLEDFLEWKRILSESHSHYRQFDQQQGNRFRSMHNRAHSLLIRLYRQVQEEMEKKETWELCSSQELFGCKHLKRIKVFNQWRSFYLNQLRLEACEDTIYSKSCRQTLSTCFQHWKRDVKQSKILRNRGWNTSEDFLLPRRLDDSQLTWMNSKSAWNHPLASSGMTNGFSLSASSLSETQGSYMVHDDRDPGMQTAQPSLAHDETTTTESSEIMSNVKEFIRKELHGRVEPYVPGMVQEAFRSEQDLERTIEHERSFQLGSERADSNPITMSLKPELGLYSLGIGQEMISSSSSLPLSEHAWPPISITNVMGVDRKDAILS